MKVGDKVKFDFAGKTKEGVVHQLHSNTVYLKVDFKRDAGKILKRKLSQLGAGKAGKEKKGKK